MHGKYKIIYLKITSYKGFLAIASHYYGTLIQAYGERKRVEVQYRLSAALARKMTREDEGFTWREGSLTTRFESREDIVPAAIELYEERFPDADLLILGSNITAEPRPILVGPSPLKERVTDIYEQCENLGWWDGPNQKECEKLSDEWSALMGFEWQ